MKNNTNKDRLGEDLDRIELEIEDELLTPAKGKGLAARGKALRKEEPEDTDLEDEDLDDIDLDDEDLDDIDLDDEDLDDIDLDDEDLDDEDLDDEDLEDDEDEKPKKKKGKGLIALLVVLILVLVVGAGLYFGTMTRNISFDPAEASIPLGSSVSVKAVFSPSFARNKQYTVSASDNSVISFDGEKITALKEGTAVLTAEQNGKQYGSCFITVTPLAVSAITFNQDASVAKVGRAFDPEPVVSPADATYPDIELSVSDESLATVEDGMILPLAAGTVTVTATNPQSGVSASFDVEIVEVEPESIAIEAPSTIELSTTSQAAVIFEPEDVTETDVVWTSSDPEVLSVENGLLTPHEAGTAQITATHSSGVFATIGVEVVPVQGKSITITSKTGSSTIKIKKSDTLTATVSPADAADKTITWTSSNENVATVNAKGKVTAKGGGEAVITASLKNGVTATYTVNVPPTATKRKSGFVVKPTADCDATITVNAEYNNNTVAYFHCEEDSSKDFCIYVVAGGDTRQKVPSGTYSVTCAIGKTWYGDGCMFYNDGTYYAFKDPFTITDADTLDLSHLTYTNKAEQIAQADFAK